jgi:EmrB/QacA subfamily drug resistance transporter
VTGSADRGVGRLLVAVVMASMLSPLNSTMLAVAIPSISRETSHVDATVTHALVTSYLVANITLQSPGGKLGDVIGHRRALSLGRWLFLAGALLATFAPGLGSLVAARIVMATGGAVIVPAATALLRTELPESRRGRAFGTFSAAMALAAMVGPLLGGALEARFGYRALFLVNVPVLLASALLSSGPGSTRAKVAPRDEVPRAPVAIDFMGIVLLAASLTALAVGAKLRGATRIELMAAGAGLLMVFVLHERRTKSPIVELGLFRVVGFTAGASVIALHNLGMYALLFLLPSMLSRLFATGSSEMGRILLAMTAAMVVASPIAGRAADRFGARLVMLVGSSIALVGMVTLRWTEIASPSALLLPLVALGVGIGLSQAPAQAAAMTAAPRERSGIAGGMISTLRHLGGVTGIVVLAMISTSDEGAGAAIAELHAATTVFIVTTALTIAASFFVGRPAAQPS